jgi:hypothetical protein
MEAGVLGLTPVGIMNSATLANGTRLHPPAVNLNNRQ